MNAILGIIVSIYLVAEHTSQSSTDIHGADCGCTITQEMAKNSAWLGFVGVCVWD